MRRLLCRIFGHVRDGRRARRTGEGWRSSCINCRAPLVRVAHGDWRLYPVAPPPTDQLDFLAVLDGLPQ